MPRFVVHYHMTPATSDRPNHWDLMLESQTAGVFDSEAKTLETWALESELVVGRKIKARQLDHHRAWFLDNDGDLSGGRGVIERQMSGEFEWLINGDRAKRVKLITAQGIFFLNITRIEGTEFAVEIIESEVVKASKK